MSLNQIRHLRTSFYTEAIKKNQEQQRVAQSDLENKAISIGRERYESLGQKHVDHLATLMSQVKTTQQSTNGNNESRMLSNSRVYEQNDEGMDLRSMKSHSINVTFNGENRQQQPTSKTSFMISPTSQKNYHALNQGNLSFLSL